MKRPHLYEVTLYGSKTEKKTRVDLAISDYIKSIFVSAKIV